MHVYDRWLLLRTTVLSALIALCALGVVIATDEPLSTPAMRVARLSALAPAMAALAVAIALAQARARGELTALSALGAGPLRRAFGALVGAWLVGAIATGLLLSPLSDVSALFPLVPAPMQWFAESTIMIAPSSGVSVVPDGTPTLGPVITSGMKLGLPPGRFAAVLAIAPLALVGPAWVAAESPWTLRALAAGLSAALVVFLLHAVAAQRAPAPVLVLAAVPLALSAAVNRARLGR